MSRTDKDTPMFRRRRYGGPPPAWYINHRWNAPDRLRRRTQCDTARSEYRATEDVDVVPAVDQHRQGATWSWT